MCSFIRKGELWMDQRPRMDRSRPPVHRNATFRSGIVCANSRPAMFWSKSTKLAQPSSRLQAGLMESDMLARLGGDTFAIFIDSINDRSKAEEVAERLLVCLCTPLTMLGGELLVSASIGIAIFS
ncbi:MULTISPECIES: diguanylate cyclase domain-containing protein [unclassified Rhizobium]|nr:MULTISPECIES: diguanylate cyclase [unclassified Rhizobium]